MRRGSISDWLLHLLGHRPRSHADAYADAHVVSDKNKLDRLEVNKSEDNNV